MQTRSDLVPVRSGRLLPPLCHEVPTPSQRCKSQQDTLQNAALLLQAFATVLGAPGHQTTNLSYSKLRDAPTGFDIPRILSHLYPDSSQHKHKGKQPHVTAQTLNRNPSLYPVGPSNQESAEALGRRRYRDSLRGVRIADVAEKPESPSSEVARADANM